MISMCYAQRLWPLRLLLLLQLRLQPRCQPQSHLRTLLLLQLRMLLLLLKALLHSVAAMPAPPLMQQIQPRGFLTRSARC